MSKSCARTFPTRPAPGNQPDAPAPGGISQRGPLLRSLLTLLLLLAASSSPAPFYGRESLAGLRKYGIAVRVVCTGAIGQHQEAFAAHLRKRLESRGVQVVPGGSVTLKLVATSIQSDDGFLVVHFALELDQSAALASNNRMVDAPTWDAWKMGEYREEELLQEVDDLARQFLVDYIAMN